MNLAPFFKIYFLAIVFDYGYIVLLTVNISKNGSLKKKINSMGDRMKYSPISVYIAVLKIG